MSEPPLRSTDRVLTTHVGSLVRPAQLIAFLERRRDGAAAGDDAAFHACLAQCVADVVRQQAEIGIDVVSDGEFGKSITWSRYVLERVDGVEYRDVAHLGDQTARTSTDATAFPEFYGPYMASQGIDLTAARGWVSTGPLRYSGWDALRRDIDHLDAALTGVDVTAAFLPVVAPASVNGVSREEGPYATEDEWVDAVAAALREEYRTIIDAGLILQIDDANLAWMYDLTVPPSTLEEYRRWATMCVEALNWALEGLPQERIRARGDRPDRGALRTVAATAGN